MKNLLYAEPGYASLHNHIGWAYLYYTNDMAQAELHLKMAIKFKSTISAPYQHLGQLMIRAGRLEEAVSYLKDGLHIQAANKVSLYDSLGQVYELKKEYGKAISSYKQAMAAGFGPESMLLDSIKRCKKKRMVMYFTF